MEENNDDDNDPDGDLDDTTGKKAYISAFTDMTVKSFLASLFRIKRKRKRRVRRKRLKQRSNPVVQPLLLVALFFFVSNFWRKKKRG